jgi:pimeloyl-ACP methyl ester carboxylesterase
MTGRTIVFIHGAWMTAQSWETFRQPFEAAGYMVLTPTWPGLDTAPAEDLRDQPPPGFGSLSVGRIVDHLEDYIEALSDKPIILGHSFGGLFTQLLLDRGLGRAGIAINPVQIAGVVPGPVSLSFALPAIARVAGWSRPYLFSYDVFCRQFANGAPPDQQRDAWERYVVPAPGRIIHQAALWLGTGVKPKRRFQPLLITSGGRDRAVSPYLSHAAYVKQSQCKARTDHRLFPQASHYLIAEPGWEEVADTALAWIRGL